MTKTIYVSCPWSYSSGLTRVVTYLRQMTKASILYNERGEDYQFSKLEQSDHVVFVLDGLAWQSKLENISKGMLTELIWCINHRKPFFLAYKAANGLGIYSAEIDENLQFKGIAGTANNLITLLSEVDNIQPSCSMRYLSKPGLTYGLDFENVYLEGGVMLSNPLDFLNEEQQTSYFY